MCVYDNMNFKVKCRWTCCYYVRRQEEECMKRALDNAV
jgi:hypothetical protein